MFKRFAKSSLLPAMGFITLFAATAYAGTPDQKAVLYYNFDQIADQTISDGSGQGHDGTSFNLSQDDYIPSQAGTALRFNGINSYVVVEKTDALAFPQNDFTISIWAKPAKDTGTLLSMLSDTTSNFGRYQVVLEKGIPAVICRADGAGYTHVRGDQPLSINQWHHLLIVFDTTEKEISLYVNGILSKRGPWKGTTWGKDNQSLYLGAHMAGQVQASYQGQLDDLQIIAKAMTPQEALTMWNTSMSILQANSVWKDSNVIGYVVPAITSTRWLAGAMPSATAISKTIKIIAAKDEFESASFILYPMKDIQKLEISSSALKGQKTGHTIDASELDIRIVKRWYQSSNAWDGYPLQNLTTRVLVPEILLHDDQLIRVDHQTQDNYLRLDKADGPEYVSVSYKRPTEYQKPFQVPDLGKIEFNYATEPVSDAKTLQPVMMKSGENRQFWMTLHVPEDAKADLYTGTITLTADAKTIGTFTIELRVLPFELPLPRAYYDMSKDYYTHAMNHARYNIEKALTGSDETALSRMRTAYNNMHEHGIFEVNAPHLPDSNTQDDQDVFVKELNVFQSSGMPMRMLGGVDARYSRFWEKFKDEADAAKRQKDFENKVDTALRLINQTLGFGPERVWFYGIDEATGNKLPIQLPAWKYVQSKGAKIYASGWYENIRTVGYSQDFHALAGKPDIAAADQWHAMGGRITTYASPFSGPEDPQLWRRSVGLIPYKANYDGFLLYIFYEGSHPNIWNDFLPQQYRNLVMVYPTKTGIIDTIAWEGFREGVDDIRYTTKMKMLAQEAINSSSIDAKHAGKKALQWLALVDSQQIDLDAFRLEVINYIDKLMDILERGKQ